MHSFEGSAEKEGEADLDISLKADVQLLKGEAAKAEASLKSIREALDAFDGIMDSLAAGWQGDAAEKVLSGCRALQAEKEALLQSMLKRPSEILSIAESYEQTEETAREEVSVLS